MTGYQNFELISVDQALVEGRRMLLIPQILMIILAAGIFVEYLAFNRQPVMN